MTTAQCMIIHPGGTLHDVGELKVPDAQSRIARSPQLITRPGNWSWLQAGDEVGNGDFCVMRLLMRTIWVHPRYQPQWYDLRKHSDE